MLVHHRYTPAEAGAALGLTTDEVNVRRETARHHHDISPTILALASCPIRAVATPASVSSTAPLVARLKMWA